MSKKKTRKTKQPHPEETREQTPPQVVEIPEEGAPPEGTSEPTSPEEASHPQETQEPLETAASAEESLSHLQEQLSEAQAQAQEYLDGWQRSRAEFANYKRRIERDRELMQQEAIIRVVTRYLPILDDLERALQNQPQEGEGAAWAQGIELIYRKMLTALEADGVQPMNAEGEMFDPNLHEAIMQEESDDHESGQIISVLQKGYRIGERVLRPALVKVAA